jgi:hypothetical protein
VRFGGTVTGVQVGGVSVPNGPIGSERVHQAIRNGELLRVSFIAGPPVTGLAPLFSVADPERRDLVVFGPDPNDLVFRYRARAADFGLDQPDLRLRRVMSAGVGEHLDAAARRTETGWCLSIEGRAERCGLGFTLGRAWSLIVYPESCPAWLKASLDVAFVFALVLPVGYWGRGPTLVLATSLTALGLIIGPGLVGLHRSIPEVVSAALALVLGQVLYRRVAPRSTI